MSVWLTIPSARPPEECTPIFAKWRERGYKIALWRDCGAKLVEADLLEVADSYPGYAAAVNYLVRRLIATDERAEWFIAAGDDTEPDPDRTAEEIAADCRYHFEFLHDAKGFDRGLAPIHDIGLFGVMQPTGDRWHEGVGKPPGVAPIDCICGSAWYGREYCRRMYQGQGPLWPEFKHMFVDEHAQCVAQKLGVLWQRRDLTQIHRHWGRGATEREIVEMHPGLIPPHLKKWNTAVHWEESQAIFNRLRDGGFKEAFDLLP